MIEDAWDPRLMRRLVFKPLAELEAGPTGGFVEVRTDYWLIAHPDKGVIFYRPSGAKGLGSIQGNRIKSYSEHHRDNIYPGALIVFSRRVLIPVDLRDYR